MRRLLVLIPRSFAGFVFVACVVAAFGSTFAWVKHPIGLGDLAAAAFIGVVFGTIGYVAITVWFEAADSGITYYGLLRKDKSKRRRW